MKKIAVFIFILCLVLAQIGVAKISQKESISVKLDDDIDQSQTTYVDNYGLPIGQVIIEEQNIDVWIAQSFIPQKETLTRVFLYIGKNMTTTYPLNLSIRHDLVGEDLTRINISSEQIPTDYFDWVEFDFEDIPVVINKPYYIVAHTQNKSDNFYAWGANNDNLSYANGCAWVSFDEGNSWGNESASLHTKFVNSKQPQPIQKNTWDMCFVTYGKFDPPYLSITKPKDAIYLANEEFATFVEPVIIGKIIIESEAWDPSGIEKVEFYIDNNLVDVVTESPYRYFWVDWCFFKHFVRVECYDAFGLETVQEIEVWKFF